MAITQEMIQDISLAVIDVLRSRFHSFPDRLSANRNAPFHEAFLQAFSNKLDSYQIDVPDIISLSSWMHGLNTTLGQTFFEKIAHTLSGGEKKGFTSGGNGTLFLTASQKSTIENVMIRLGNASVRPDYKAECSSIPPAGNDAREPTTGFIADVYFEDDTSITAIELKSVKPNAGEMKGEKRKILAGRTALLNLNPQKEVRFYIGFPFDPTVDTAIDSPCNSDKSRFLNNIVDGNKYFDQCEVLLANELWDLLSNSENTMQTIIDIINAIATPDFEDNFFKLNNRDQCTEEHYVRLLREWNLFSEIYLYDHREDIIRAIGSDSRLKIRLNQNIFNVSDKYRYRYDRFRALARLIDGVV